MGTITLSMIVKNEEKYLRECLESVRNVVDEIVIVDTGSTDNTVEIAKDYKAKIYHFDWVNDFSAARNYGLQYSSCDWILYLDADERLDSSTLKELKKLTNEFSKIGYYCTIKSVADGDSSSIRYVRLFKNSKDIKFTGKVHEQIVPSLIENKYKLLQSNILINHIGYDISDDEKKLKAQRNLTLLLEDFEKNKSPYIAYKIAHSYLMIEQYEEAKLYFNNALHRKELSKELKADSYYYLSLIAYRNNDLELAHNLLDKAVELNPVQPIYYYKISKFYLQQNELYKAKLYAVKALEAGKNVINIERVNKQTIYIDLQDVIYYGLYLAYKTNDNDNIEYFSKELYKLLKLKDVQEKLRLIKLFENIFQHKGLNDEISKILVDFSNKSNLELFLLVISKQKSIELRLNILKKLEEKFSHNIEVLKSIALLYEEINDINLAIKVFEENMEIIKSDPTALFYLASFYLKGGRIKDSYELFNTIENKFHFIPSITPKISLIKSRLEELLVRNK